MLTDVEIAELRRRVAETPHRTADGVRVTYADGPLEGLHTFVPAGVASSTEAKPKLPELEIPEADASLLVVKHEWNDLTNAGTNGTVNDAQLVNNGLDPIVADGTATVFNGGTPGPGVPFGDDDGYISFGAVEQFTGATYFELRWEDLDLDEDAGSSHVLCGALQPGFSAGSQTIVSANGVGGGNASISVTLYEAGGAFGGGDAGEVVESTALDNVLPSATVDFTLIYAGNGLRRSEGGLGIVWAYVNDELIAQASIAIGVINPDETPADFGIGKYHDGSTVAGAYSTGTFEIAFAPTPSCDGDLTGDGATDSADLNEVLGAFGTTYDSTDLNEVLGNFGCGG